MAKVKFTFNPHTLKYERYQVPFRIILLRTLAYIITVFICSFLILLFLYFNFNSPKEKLLKQTNQDLIDNYSILNDQLHILQSQVNELENRDNNIYRTIFEASPIPDSIRLQMIEKEKEVQRISVVTNNELVKQMSNQVNNLKEKIAFQTESYNDIVNMIKNKQLLLAAIPSIQPVSNKDLSRIASGFGYRIDPIYKIPKFHAGIDFAAPLGTPIYATADGVVTEADFNTGGYGNHVVINHGYGYQTLYGHMLKTKATIGAKVKRGEVIGYVGSTGKSTGPHLHYEIKHYGYAVDPIYYFYNDLSPSQYDRVLKLGASNNQSLD